MKMKILIALAVLLIAVVSGTALVALRSSHIRQAYQTAHNGDREQVVLARLGNPWRRSGCGQAFGGTFPKACAQELIYRHPLAPAISEYWSFQYDASGVLVGTYEYVSP